jgi:hypothetical protein
MMKKVPPIILDGKPVEKITAFLLHTGGNDDPQKLIANESKSFIGSYVLGMGFTFDDRNSDATTIAEMKRLIEKEPRNQDRIFPYIGGEEVNSSSTHAHNRYVINFGEMSEDEAREWPDLMSIVEMKVKPERMKNNREGYKRYWWQHGEKRVDLFKAIKGLDQVLVRPRTSKHNVFALLPNKYVYSENLVIFALSQNAFPVIHSRIHEIWTTFTSSTLEDRQGYRPSDCFETFPFPENWETNPKLESIGQEYYEFRAALMIRNNQGLTDTYNRFHDPEETDPEILKLRELHTQMDTAVLTAYGWTDIPTTCEFRLDYEDEEPSDTEPTEGKRQRKKPWRYRWPAATHDEVLARLLDLNQQRYEMEAIEGKKAQKKADPKKPKTTKKKPDKKKAAPIITSDKQLTLIAPEIEQLEL